MTTQCLIITPTSITWPQMWTPVPPYGVPLTCGPHVHYVMPGPGVHWRPADGDCPARHLGVIRSERAPVTIRITDGPDIVLSPGTHSVDICSGLELL